VPPETPAGPPARAFCFALVPNAPPKPCDVCGTLVRDGTRRCVAHKPKPWVRTERQVKRTAGRALQRQREQLFRVEPLCRQCAREGRTALATIRDHIQPLAEGGGDDDANIQPLCRSCSDRKTAREAARGRGGGSNV
jgi:5-methylcytosine-specific restriction protein A